MREWILRPGSRRRFFPLLLLILWLPCLATAETPSPPSSPAPSPASSTDSGGALPGDDEVLSLTVGELRAVLEEEVSRAVDEAVQVAVAPERAARAAAEVEAARWKAELEKRLQAEFWITAGGILAGLLLGLLL